MTLESDDGSRTPSLEKPYRKVSQRWRPCLASLLFFTVVLLDNFVTCLSVSTHFHNPWMSDDFLLDSTSSSKVSPTCPMSRGSRQSQCLSLEYLCALSPGREREKHFVQLNPCFCSHYPLLSVLEPRSRTLVIEGSVEECLNTLTSIRDLDDLARQMMCEFESLLNRYDCGGEYTVQFSCPECKNVYREWVCAMLLPFFLDDSHLKPCRTFCHRVEQQCPYFHPYITEQYAGEPVFKCIDPNIPDIPSISPNSPYGLPGSCYQLCHVNPDIEPKTWNTSFFWKDSTVTRTNSNALSLKNTSHLSPATFSRAVTKTANPCLMAGLFIIIGGLWRHLVIGHCTQRSSRWTWPNPFGIVCIEPT
ncbi:transmembrane protein FAM155B-like [Limulus polyphemus]|uniref:Transmembrane protein FAM155B-like n=1 Tax=Limulus polyphemus TaxID=6850 RepID=A0ABM1SGA0_LIMPO|nr:transmembrane protein FAM155B-like [Limulus polyphemus]